MDHRSHAQIIVLTLSATRSCRYVRRVDPGALPQLPAAVCLNVCLQDKHSRKCIPMAMSHPLMVTHGNMPPRLLLISRAPSKGISTKERSLIGNGKMDFLFGCSATLVYSKLDLWNVLDMTYSKPDLSIARDAACVSITMTHLLVTSFHTIDTAYNALYISR